jgi:transcriptional regulator GlxA family with amidase domain
MSPTRSVVIVGAPPVQVLDVTGPLEVFSSAGGYDVIATPGTERTLQTHRRVALTDAVPIAEIDGPIDTLLVAGGPGAETGIYDACLLGWIAKAAQRSRQVASICTGAFLLGAAGLLDGKQVVTHWRLCDRLAKEFPRAMVAPGPNLHQGRDDVHIRGNLRRDRSVSRAGGRRSWPRSGAEDRKSPCHVSSSAPEASRSSATCLPTRQ